MKNDNLFMDVYFILIKVNKHLYSYTKYSLILIIKTILATLFYKYDQTFIFFSQNLDNFILFCFIYLKKSINPSYLNNIVFSISW